MPKKKPTHVCPEGHKHGQTNTCYVNHRCRCQNCKDGCARRAAVRRKAIAYGRYVSPQYVPTLRAVGRIRYLQSFGHNYDWIGRAAGVSPRTIWKLNTFHVERCGVDIEAKILSVKPDFDSLSDGHVIPSTGVRRRIQALATRGWSQRELSRRLGLHADNVSKFMYGEQVQMRTHRKVSALYEELWDLPAPAATRYERQQASRVKNHARALGWVPPMGWDDIDTDPEPPAADVQGEPFVDDVKVAHALSGENKHGLNYDEKRAAVRIGHSRRWSDPLIAERIGIAQETVQRIRGELDLPAWAHDEQINRQEAAA
jgi:DNA-binding Xre family transcriptional regulator